MNIRFLKDLESVEFAIDRRCGDGCCSWTERYTESVKAGEEHEVDDWYGVTESALESLEVGVDYIIIPEV